MTRLAVQAAPAPTAPSRGDRVALRTLWGLDAYALHDRLWAAHGIGVARRGEGLPADARADAWLLLPAGALLLPTRAADLLAALAAAPGARLVTLRVRPPGPSYAERVVVGRRDELLAVERCYDEGDAGSVEILATDDRDAALAWAEATSRASARRVRRGRRVAEAAGTGEVGSMRRLGGPERVLRRLVRGWSDAPGLAALAPETAPGVFAHPTARLDPAARVLGPAWLGAGVQIGADEIVVGPCVLGDAATVAPSPPVSARTGRRRGSGRAAPSRDLSPERIVHASLALLALLVTAPLLPLIALAIWLEDGRPILFGHRRQGLGGRPFTCLKFRTMCRDAERLKTELAAQNICDGPQFHIADDPRLLRIGRVLRRFHLDELPQFWNVVRGDMNLVGPRPSPESENRLCPAWRAARLSVRPGITGLWQVRRTRRPGLDFQEWIRFDLEYVAERSWRLDAWILLRTALSLAARSLDFFRPASAATDAAGVATASAPAEPVADATGTAPLARIGPAVGESATARRAA